MLPLQESFEKNDLAQNIWSKQEIEYPIRRRNAHVQTTGLKTKTQTPLSQSWCTQQHTNARNAKRSLCVNMTRTRRHNMTYSRCARPTYVIIPPPHPTPPPHPQKTETQKKRASCHGRKGVVVQLHTPDKSHHFWNLKKLAVFLNKARKNHHPEFPKPPWIFGEFFFSGWSGVTSIATWCTCSPNCCFFNCSSAPQAKAPTDRTHNMQASASCNLGGNQRDTKQAGKLMLFLKVYLRFFRGFRVLAS